MLATLTLDDVLMYEWWLEKEGPFWPIRDDFNAGLVALHLSAKEDATLDDVMLKWNHDHDITYIPYDDMVQILEAKQRK